MNEKRWILWVHGMILLIAIALQITVGAFAFAYRNQGTEVLDRAWERVFRSDPRVIQDLETFVSSFGFGQKAKKKEDGADVDPLVWL